jgi:hypothetical protein
MNKHKLKKGDSVEYKGKIYRLFNVTDDYPFLDTIEFGFGVVEWKDIKPVPNLRHKNKNNNRMKKTLTILSLLFLSSILFVDYSDESVILVLITFIIIREITDLFD